MITVVLAVNTILLAYLAFRWRSFMIEQFKTSDTALADNMRFVLAKLGATNIELSLLRSSILDSSLKFIALESKLKTPINPHVMDTARYSSAYPKKNKNKGRKLTPEQKKAISDRATEKWASYTEEQRAARVGALRKGQKKIKKAARKEQPVQQEALALVGGNVSNPI